MAGDRTIAPTAARIARAWRQGLRPAHRWLGAAAAVWAVTLVIPRVVPPSDAVVSLGDELAAPGVADVAALEPILWSALMVAVAISAAVAAAAVVASVVAGTFGPRSRPSVQPAPPARAFDGLWPLVAIAVVGGLIAAAVGVVAGASRAPDATGSGLRELWLSWGLRVGTVTGALLVGAGLAELALERWRNVRRLYATAEQLREERARRGGGRR